MKGFTPEFLEKHRKELGPHAYRWTGRSPDTCAFTVGSDTWCALSEDDPVHLRSSDQ